MPADSYAGYVSQLLAKHQQLLRSYNDDEEEEDAIMGMCAV